MGYSVYEGPDVDTVYNTFDALNSPENHPARDMTDTFYVSEDTVLRPHTSSAEIRAEHDLALPYKVLIPGRCYRVDTPDATHSPTFHQIEMMVIGEGINMGDLKGSLDHMAKQLFGPETRTKFRPPSRAQKWTFPVSNAAARAALFVKAAAGLKFWAAA